MRCDSPELIEVRCEQCRNLFATDPDHSAFFCSLVCEQAWRAERVFEKVPF